MDGNSYAHNNSYIVCEHSQRGTDQQAIGADHFGGVMPIEGFTISLAVLEDAPAIAKVHVDTWRSQYAEIVSQDYLDNLSYEKREVMWSRLLSAPEPCWHLFVLKNVNGKVIGFSCGGKNRSDTSQYEGEVYAIYLDKKYQGKGLGKKLMSKTLSQLRADGFKSCSLWVLERNTTRKFYEIMGGKPVGEKMADIGGVQYKEILYGWSDLSYILDD